VTVAFEEELLIFGPGASKRKPVLLSEAEAYCRKLAKTHYENFPVVSWLLPKKLHQHFYNVYAYCRWADDLGDEVEGAERSLELLGWWRGELSECYSVTVEARRNECGSAGALPSRAQTGSMQHPVFVALQKTITECNIPQQPFEDLIAAFEQDQRVLEYDSFEQLLDYCCRSANPVGRLVLYVCGQFNAQNATWSDSICTGLQLANFWQDVARDYDIGRVYLPAEDRERFGYGQNDLESRITNDAFLQLMQFEVERAKEFLLAGLPLVERMPGRMQIDIELFVRGGLKILERIERNGYRVWDERPVVTKGDVASLFVRSVCHTFMRSLKFRRNRIESL
jgi:squalene synthase HpnC